jgi:hypothetical protein
MHSPNKVSYLIYWRNKVSYLAQYDAIKWHKDIEHCDSCAALNELFKQDKEWFRNDNNS